MEPMLLHVSGFTISYVQITYQWINFGLEVQNMVLLMPKIVIKSAGCINSAISVSTRTVGSQSFIFNQWFASIKSAFILAGGGTPYYSLDVIDISYLGTYQIQVGRMCLQLHLNAGQNKSAILQELRKATGALYGTKNSMSINWIEFAYTDAAAVTTTY